MADKDKVVHSFSKGFVLFNDNMFLAWGNADGHAVIDWVKSFDTAKNAVAKAHKGVFYACVIMEINAEVIFELTS
jgi:hypothetical protein